MARDPIAGMRRTLFALAADPHNRCDLYVQGMPPLTGAQLARGAGDDVIVAYRAGEKRPQAGLAISIVNVIAVQNMNAASSVDVRNPQPAKS